MTIRRALSRGLLTGWLAVLAQVVWAGEAEAQIVINEVEYDEPSTDTAEYIELRNVSASPVNLSGYSLVFVNGAGGGAAVYRTIALPSVSLGAGQYYVVCGNAANTPNCNLDVTPDTDLIQNGSPDALALRLGTTDVDRVSYEGNVPGFTETNGAPTESGSAANEGLSRCADGADSNDNSIDFLLKPNTPGAANACAVPPPPLGQCGDPATAIGAVQGTGPTSPLAGQVVVIEGVVVGDFQDSDINGFAVQEEDSNQDGNPATSDGIFVFEGGLPVPVNAGNLVRVRGTVAEFSALTELTSILDIVVCPGSPIASAQTLTFPVAALSDLERYEGMLVNIPQTLTVTGNFELGRFGSLDLSAGGRLLNPTHVVPPGMLAIAQQSLNDRSRIILDDLSDIQNPNPIPYKDGNNTRRVGDTIPSLTGILEGRFNAYRIQPTVAPIFANANLRPPAPANVGGRLRVAALNVLNFFTTLDDSPTGCGPLGTLECRGANTVEEFDRQRAKLLNMLAAVNGDVVGLIEIENNPSTAVQDLVDGLNARPEFGPGTYAYVNTGAIGTDAIKLALIYKPAKLTLPSPFSLLTAAVDPRFNDTKNRPALGQTFTEIGTGARFTVVLNHLKSKGSDCNDVGDPDLGDGQGNCNQTRTLAAAALVDWAAALATQSGDPDVVIMGDLNAHTMEDPLTTLIGGGFHSLPALFIDAQQRYSYQFQGQSAHLDHALTNGALTPQVTGATFWHSNTDEPVVLDYNLEFKTDDPFTSDDPFRASDHDGIVFGLNLTGAPAPVPAGSTWHLLALQVLLLAVGTLVLLRNRRGPLG